MPCASPLQAVYSVRPDGKKNISFCPVNSDRFQNGVKGKFDGQFCKDGEWFEVSGHLSLPCGKCMPCRLERSRQVAARCVHESKMYDDNCFITLTYSDDYLPLGGTLVRSHPQGFMKRLRDRFSDVRIRFYGCGEYGESLSRPHYHFCLFNFDFKDRVLFYSDSDFDYFTSAVLADLWPFGHSTVCDFSFETAAYVARYCTKKINGVMAKEHYGERLPEFSMFSNRPGIGKPWFDRYAVSDMFPHDSIVVRGVECKPPRYYDILRERVDPIGFAAVQGARELSAVSKSDDNTYDRLQTKLKCTQSRFKKLIRRMEDV